MGFDIRLRKGTSFLFVRGFKTAVSRNCSEAPSQPLVSGVQVHSPVGVCGGKEWVRGFWINFALCSSSRDIKNAHIVYGRAFTHDARVERSRLESDMVCGWPYNGCDVAGRGQGDETLFGSPNVYRYWKCCFVYPPPPAPWFDSEPPPPAAQKSARFTQRYQP